MCLSAFSSLFSIDSYNSHSEHRMYQKQHRTSTFSFPAPGSRYIWYRYMLLWFSREHRKHCMCCHSVKKKLSSLPICGFPGGKRCPKSDIKECHETMICCTTCEGMRGLLFTSLLVYYIGRRCSKYKTTSSSLPSSLSHNLLSISPKEIDEFLMSWRLSLCLETQMGSVHATSVTKTREPKNVHHQTSSIKADEFPV
jgi:hypothetical protein